MAVPVQVDRNGLRAVAIGRGLGKPLTARALAPKCGCASWRFISDIRPGGAISGGVSCGNGQIAVSRPARPRPFASIHS